MSQGNTSSAGTTVPRGLSRLVVAGFGLALVAVVAAIIAGAGNANEWWGLGQAFAILRWASFGAIAAFALTVAGFLRAKQGGPSGEFKLLLAGLLISFGFVNYIFSQLDVARSVPNIHDITTDFENPPAFVDVIPLREHARNSYEYGGPELAAQQREGYPDLAPLELKVAPGETIERARRVAEGMGWEIVAMAPAEGRLEATDTTFWFGFKDDVVVRVTAIEGGSRVDVRSVSRVGGSDVGANAKRIKAFLKRLTVL